MTFRPVLLRVLLMLGLVLNGLGPSMASAHVHEAQVPASAHDSSASQQGPVKDPPCAGHRQAPETVVVPPTHVQGATEAADPPLPPQDGCLAAACPGACTQQAAAAIIAASCHVARVAPAVAARRSAVLRPPPALPHLIRPPIG